MNEKAPVLFKRRTKHEHTYDDISIDCVTSLVIGLVKTQFPKLHPIRLGEVDFTSIKNADIVKKESKANLDNGQFLIILQHQHPTAKS